MRLNVQWAGVGGMIAAAVCTVVAEEQGGAPAPQPPSRTPVAIQDKKGRGQEKMTVDFVVNALPASVLINVDSDKFVLESDSTRTTLSTVYLMPNLSAGVGVEWWRLYVDFTLGAGVVVNDSFRSFLLQGAVAASYAATDTLRIGPRLGLIAFPSPRWIGDGDADFNTTWGLLAGLQLSMGDRISYLVSVDLISASFDAEPSGAGSALRQNELELTGLAVQFGVRGEF